MLINMSISSEKICQNLEMNNMCNRLIDCYIATTEFPTHFRCLNLRYLLFQTQKELSLSVVETVGWLILLEEIGLKIESINPKYILLYTAIKAKKILGNVTKREYFNLQMIYPSLLKDFKVWSKETLTDGIISIKKLGKKFSELNLPPNQNVINYNFYVDYVLGNVREYKSYLLLEQKNSKPYKKRQIHNVSDRNVIDEREFERIDN
ncbi:hypothetical protein SteCoe_3216 [Stentor coeruleus]|uniref:Uncharacterized protein n=1 Tax=Stentor coeruleus TaxID=5963 RepID=A0A1R2CXR9_9CILI|nr:hypothetical protein SteCoe_3216 [Stentor coeruleus]